MHEYMYIYKTYTISKKHTWSSGFSSGIAQDLVVFLTLHCVCRKQFRIGTLLDVLPNHVTGS